MHAKEHGIDDVSDLLLNACLNDLRYDSQAEPVRGDWLYEMISGTEHEAALRKAVFEAISQQQEYYLWQQLASICKGMALKGNEQAQHLLRSFSLTRANDPKTIDLGANEWIEVGGTNALLELARIYGEQILISANVYPTAFLDIFNKKDFDARNFLKQHGESDLFIKTYAEYIDSVNLVTKPTCSNTDAKNKYSLENLLEASKGNAPASRFRNKYFGKDATNEELEKVYDALISATTDVERVKLLWVFIERSLPKVNELFLQWAENADFELRQATTLALANTTDSRIHSLAQSKVRNGCILENDGHSIKLFKSNYCADDVALIREAIYSLNDETDDLERHKLGFDIRDICESQSDLKLVPLILWSYEYNPCSVCRERAIKLLDQFGFFTKELIEECLHDGSKRIREYASKF